MNDELKSTRLGDLLVERGIITRLQLAHAIELQEIRRQHAVRVNAPDSYTQQFGELLIELGFINRSQLKSSLSWQRRLRKTTAMMVFVAPLLTAACGGGGGSGGAGGTGPNTTQSSTPSSQTVTSEPLSSTPRESSLSSSLPASSLLASSLPTNSLPASSAPGSVSVASSSIISSSSAIPVLTPSSAHASSMSSVSSSTPIVNGTVYFRWTPPNQRKNGQFLDITEVGGYELRYKRKSENQYTSIIIHDSYIDTYYFENLQGDYEFEIAAFDIHGLYSIFVTIKPI